MTSTVERFRSYFPRSGDYLVICVLCGTVVEKAYKWVHTDTYHAVDKPPAGEHRPVRIWQEKPSEFSYTCSCGMVMKHQIFGDWPECLDKKD